MRNAALVAGLPESSLPQLLEQYKGNVTSVPGMNDRIAEAVHAAVVTGAAESYRYVICCISYRSIPILTISFRYVWYAVIAFGACAIIAASLTIDYGDYFNDDVTRKLQNVNYAGGVQEHEESKVAEVGVVSEHQEEKTK